MGGDDFDLDRELLEFVMSSAPPAFSLGSTPPSVVLSSMPPLEQRRVVTVPPGPAQLVERLVVTGLSAVDPELAEAPTAPTSPTERAARILADLQRAGPGDEAPLVESLLTLGPEVLPVVVDAFPGCLWFDRHLPHQKVARGRDVSAVARALVAFGEASGPHLSRLTKHRHPDIRFYAALVAAEIASAELLERLGELALDEDEQVRLTATASLVGVEAEVAEPARAWLRRAVADAERPRETRLRAMRALARLRDERACDALIEVFSAYDPERSSLAQRALTVITGRDLGPDRERWAAWHAEHRGRGRARWLVDALETEDALLFSFLLRELEGLAGRTFSDDRPDDHTSRDRVREACRAWLKLR